MLVIIALAVFVAGFCLWVVQFIATPTVRTLLRVFIGLCLAAVIAFLVLPAMVSCRNCLSPVLTTYL